MSEDTTYTCPECEQEKTLDSDGGAWSSKADALVCFDCQDSDVQHSSTVIIAENGFITKYRVGDLFILDEHFEEPNLNINISRTYHPTDGWRGYYETKVDGFEPILDGWTTGGWGDSTAQRKQTFNDWAESIIDGEVIPPFPVVIVLDPTSNVFSTAVTVLVKNPSEAQEWLDSVSESDIESLSRSLS